MRFEVKYPSGQPHEVELSGSVAVLGRDPTCDLVLNDARCSRRHAVLEAGPQGISIRDAGSANGVYVNGRKVERAQLADGDVVRLGEVFLKVLPEEVAGTVVMAPEDLDAAELPHPPSDEPTASVRPTPVEAMTPRPPPPAPMPAPASSATPLPRVSSQTPSPARAGVAPAGPAAPTPAPQPPAQPPRRPPAPPARPTAPASRQASGPSPGPVARPLTVTLLAVFWMIGLLYYPIVTVVWLPRLGGVGALALGAAGALATLVSGVMAWGLWTRRGWARFAQIAAAIFGVLTCAFAPASATILAYLFRTDVQDHFGERRPEGPGAGENGRLEPYFAVAVAALIVLPLLLALLLALLGAVAAPAAAPSQ